MKYRFTTMVSYHVQMYSALKVEFYTARLSRVN